MDEEVAGSRFREIQRVEEELLLSLLEIIEDPPRSSSVQCWWTKWDNEKRDQESCEISMKVYSLHTSILPYTSLDRLSFEVKMKDKMLALYDIWCTDIISCPSGFWRNPSFFPASPLIGDRGSLCSLLDGGILWFTPRGISYSGFLSRR